MSQSEYPILRTETAAKSRKVQHSLLIIKPATMTQSAQTTTPPYQH